MIIKRNINGKEIDIELTSEELAEANAEFVTAFMKDTLINDFNLDDETADQLADEAYQLYCEGDGKTEYECIETVYENYKEQ